MLWFEKIILVGVMLVIAGFAVYRPCAELKRKNALEEKLRWHRESSRGFY